MLESITIKSFKSFIDSTIKLNNLTILTGLNNSGKSSIIQAIRMCLLCNDNLSPYISGYGDFSDLKSKLSAINNCIEISLIIKDSKECLSITLAEDEVKCSSNIPQFSYDYVSADRHGPNVILPTMDANISNISVGARGEYFVDYYLKFENVIIPELVRHESSVGNLLKHQVVYWMREISPGIDLEFDINKKHDITHLEVNGFRATNTGFGISYVLPIVLAALTMSSLPPLDDFKYTNLKKWHNCKDKLLIVENPEAHLHPRGQTALGKLIALASACGVQIIVETHSDHFLDGVRLAVKQFDVLLPENCSILYFSREKNLESTSEEIKINKDGKLTSWPVGFFDQASINLSKLAKRDQK
ncbi:TPA: AAA family ATPase [Serratia fonticola]